MNIQVNLEEKKPLISVIVPVYKVEKYLSKCVDSIIRQTYTNLEIILVDDGSPDNCPIICDEYAQKDSRVKVIHKKNGGLSCARNAALDICCGEFVSFIDSDDWIEENAYEILMKKIVAYNLDVVVFNFSRVIDDCIVPCESLYADDKIFTPKEMIELSLKDEIGGQVWFKFFRKKLWDNIRFPVGRLYEDIAVSFLPYTFAKKNIGYISTPLYFYRQNPNGISLSGGSLHNYHIFLGFVEHLNYAEENCRNVREACLAKAATFAIGSLNNYYRYKTKEGKNYLPHVQLWLHQKRDDILSCKKLKKKTAIMLRVYYFMPKIYPILYDLFILFERRNN